MPPQHLDTMMYIDDSGHPQSGSVVYGWVSFSPDRWSDVLGSWMNNRKNLYRTYGVPIAQELHMTDYVLGAGVSASNRPRNSSMMEGFFGRIWVVLWRLSACGL